MRKILYVFIMIFALFVFASCEEINSVNVAEIENSITFNSKEIAYDGQTHTISYSANLKGGYVIEFNGEPHTEIGEYPYVIKVKQGDKVVFEKTVYLKITDPNYAEFIDLQDKEITYDGNNHKLEYSSRLSSAFEIRFTNEEHSEVGTYQYKLEVYYNNELKYEKTANLVIKDIARYNVDLVYVKDKLNVTADKELTNIREGEKVTFEVAFQDGYELDQILLNGTPVNKTLVDGKFSLIIDKAYTLEVKAKELVDNPGEITEKQKYNVSLTFDSEKLNVTANQVLGEVEENTVITFRVSINPGYQFSEIKINGQVSNMALVNGEFNLTIDKDYSIEVTVVEVSSDDYTEVTTPWIEG